MIFSRRACLCLMLVCQNVLEWYTGPSSSDSWGQWGTSFLLCLPWWPWQEHLHHGKWQTYQSNSLSPTSTVYIFLEVKSLSVRECLFSFFLDAASLLPPDSKLKYSLKISLERLDIARYVHLCHLITGFICIFLLISWAYFHMHIMNFLAFKLWGFLACFQIGQYIS